jgi:hypothetical protein
MTVITYKSFNTIGGRTADPYYWNTEGNNTKDYITSIDHEKKTEWAGDKLRRVNYS